MSTPNCARIVSKLVWLFMQMMWICFPVAVTGPIGWHDIRGNHDGFNVPYWQDADSNPYIKLASRVHGLTKEGTLNHRHYAVDHTDAIGRVHRIVTFDAVVEPAPTRHFFGRLTTQDMNELTKLLQQAPKPYATLVMGHYPFNSIISDRSSAGLTFEQLMAKHQVSALLSGHLHQWPSVFKYMRARHEGGTMELEVADFKYNSVYRLCAFDDGVFSFVDSHLGDRPALLITSPADARYGNPWNAPQLGPQRKNRIRFLVYSNKPISFVGVRINRRVLAAYNLGKKEGGDILQLQRSSVPFHGENFNYSYFAHPDMDAGDVQADEVLGVSVAGAALHRQSVHAKRGFPDVEVQSPGKTRTTSASVFWVDVPWEVLAEFTRVDASELGSTPPPEAEAEGGVLPQHMPKGSHTIQITVLDIKGSRRVTAQPFTMDGSVLNVPFPISQWFMTSSFRDTLSGVTSALSTVVVMVTLIGAALYDKSLGVDPRMVVVPVAAPATVQAQTAGGVTMAARVWGPYVVLKRMYPKLFWLMLLYGLYAPMGPWMVGPIFDNQFAIMFAWGIVPLSSGVPRLPHYDGDITLMQVFLIGLAPALQLASMAAIWRARSGAAGAAVVSYAERIRSPTTLVGSWQVYSPASLPGILLLVVLLLHWAVLCLPAIVIHGVIAAALAPVQTWAPLAMAVLGLRAVLCAACGRCAARVEQKAGKDA